MKKEELSRTGIDSGTDPKKAAKTDSPELRNEVVASLLNLFLHTTSRQEFLDRALEILLRLAGIKCGGIRVADEMGNLPFVAYSGFDEQFLQSEKWVSSGIDDCACIRIALGKSEPQDARAMTAWGSFCCNNTQKFLAGMTDEEQSRFRGVCIDSGYTSLAIIPLRYAEKNLGVIHLADKREGCFPGDFISFLESSIAPLISEGIHRFNIETQLEYNLETQTVLTSLLRFSLQDLTLDEILNLSLDLIHSSKTFSFSTKSLIFLVEKEPDVLVLKATRGFSERSHQECSRVAFGQCICGKAAQKQELIFTDLKDYSHDILPAITKRYLHYCVPIKSGKTLLGVLTLYLEENHRRNQREGEFLVAAANTLAGIIWRKRSEDELRTLSRRLVSIQEEERRAIALELHDQIGQLLTGLKLMINQATRSGSEMMNPSLEEAQIVVSDLIVKVREMSLNLRPSMLDDLGLLPTLLWHFQQCNAQARLNINFRHSGLERDFPKDVSIAAYRIVQEALTNIMRYAGVSEVFIDAWVDEGALHLRIEDKGKGFEANQSTLNMTVGLQGMRERATLLGGNLSIESTPGVGTRITADLPLQVS